MINSLQRSLVILGLIAIPFYELFFKVFPFVKVIAPDSREPKTLIAVLIALSIGLLAIFQGTLKPFKNKWFLLIVPYLLVSMWMSPDVSMSINNVESGDFWFWKPFGITLCFVFMLFAVSSLDEDVKPILNVMAMCGAVMAGYVVLQKLGFDQFWMKREGQEFSAVTEQLLGGNLGQPTIVASFMVMLIPVAIYLKRYICAGLTTFGVLLTSSDAAIISTVLIGLAFLGYFKKFLIIPILALLFALILGIGTLYLINPKFQTFANERSNGRNNVWVKIFSDFRNGPIIGSIKDFSFTGVGFGRFPFIFPDKNKSNFQQAHNEFLEFTYNCGLIGLGLLLTGLYITFYKAGHGYLSFAVLVSFLSILFCSLFSFPFQLAAHQFYSVVLLGILNNKKITGGLA